jgi:DNA processing protein
VTPSIESSGGEYDCALGLAWSGMSGNSLLLTRLIEVGAKGIWGASRATLLGWGISERAAGAFVEARQRFDPSEARAALHHAGQQFIPFGSPLYPPELWQLGSPPVGLFLRGSREVWDSLMRMPRITVVGTRRATAEGLMATEAFVAALSRRGIAVISGMALGIDARAHKSALDHGGPTVAVLGCGADVVYPPRHRWLYDRILRSGMVASELPPGSHPTKWTFPHRNRLLAALADAVLVVEGSNTSGALQTARWALELGRQVFCVPGSIFNEASEGCNSLIYDGGFSALRPADLVEDFLRVTRMERGERCALEPTRVAAGEQMPLAGVSPFDGASARVFEALRPGPRSVDGLVTVTGLSVREVSTALGEMEIRGLVCRGGPGIFLRAP